MANSKIQLSSGVVLLDLTGDTVAADNLLSGVTAHDKTGAQITGTLALATVYTGSGAPSDNLGSDGDIYLDMG